MYGPPKLIRNFVMHNKKQLKMVALAAVLICPATVFAEAGISTCVSPCDPTAISNNINLKVIVPEVLIFKVGDLGNTINTVTWTLSPSGFAPLQSDPDYSGSVPFTATDFDAPGVTNDETNNADGVLNVYAFGNDGDINITSTATNGDTLDATSGETIPLSDISVTGDSHPTNGTSGLNGGTDGTVAAIARVAELNTTWEYAYVPTTTPASGTYDTVITYTASMP